MPPSTEPIFASDGKWSLYVDKEDSFSPPPSEQRPKTQTKARSLANPKPSVPPTVDNEDSSSPIPPQRRPKAKSKAGSKANPGSSGARPKKPDGDSEKNDSDADTPQDGRGDPNLSGITPPLPVSLVEPQLLSHDTGFHVITTGIEVGITTVKGMADSRLACRGPSSQTFSTWKQAQSYYNVCFNDGSVIIRPALQDQTPVQSPVRKKWKVKTKPLEHESLSQPPFAPAFNTPKAKGSASRPINVSSAESTPESQSTRSYTPLFFPESPPRPHVGAQTHNGASRTGKNPASAGVQTIPCIIPNVPSPSRSLGHIDPRSVSVESSSDDGDATDSNVNSAAANRPGPSSSLVVEAHSDAPTSYSRSSSVIEISDSEGESEIAWPPSIVRPDADTIRELLSLFHPDNTNNQRQHPSGYRRY